jgi:lipoprotein-anchoring transpeptidase ErfK/SrfK
VGNEAIHDAQGLIGGLEMAAPKPDKTKKIVVNLDRQVVVLYQSGEAILTFDCVSGDEDHPTPEGHFKVLRKQHPCFSTEFNVPMDHALFFTNRGHALHQGLAVGFLSYLKSSGIDSIGSHGCVRLSEEDASSLYDWASVGTSIWIHRALPEADY